jgi:ABC-2 type transport system ATP-binding protein
MPTVALEHVSKAYDKKIAVDDLSLQIEPGTMFGLLGPNGAGKTSSIRMMIGITVPDSGSVTLLNVPFNRKSLQRIGYMPEERGLYKKMKIVDQLVLMGELHGIDAKTSARRAQKWCERMQIGEALRKKTDELSKGMQQKIQFISTVLHDPELIIMDEPFSGLDPVNAMLLQDVLLELKADGRAILFSTHRMDQVEKLCDQICLIDHGKAVLSGSVRDLKACYPRDRVVVEFEGSDAFLRSEMVEEARNFNGQAELKLKQGADAQTLLHEAAAGAKIYKFDLKEPSLEEIFIQTVGGRVDA